MPPRRGREACLQGHKNGNVSAAAPGKAVITVTTESGKKASCNVLVGLRQGDVISSGIYRYKVTDSSVDGTGQMEVAGFIKGRRAQPLPLLLLQGEEGFQGLDLP